MKEYRLGIFEGKLVRYYDNGGPSPVVKIIETWPNVYDDNGDLKPQYWAIKRYLDVKGKQR